MVFLCINYFKMIQRVILAFAVLSLMIGCDTKKEVPAKEATVSYAKFGDSISTEQALTSAEMMEKFASLKEGDTLSVKFKSTIHEICQNKGCWMTLDLADGVEAFVKFKDYGFFVPMNAQKRDVIVEGKAFIEETPIAELKHYAEDEGKSKAAIDSIVAPKKEFKFLAHGVLIAK
jgi:hypothetical protein